MNKVIFYGMMPVLLLFFLRKIQWKEALDFDTVMKAIRDRLQPMAERYWIKLSK